MLSDSATLCTEGEQHCQQVGVVDAAIAVHIAPTPSVQQERLAAPRGGVVAFPYDVASIPRDIVSEACQRNARPEAP